MRIAALSIAIALLFLAPEVSHSASAGKHFIKGTVKTASGKPARRHWVILEAGQGTWRYLTGDDGRYFLGFVNEGRYRLRVMRRKRQLFGTDVTLPHNGPLDIRLTD